jgi:Arc/MetJ family transcription regulator
MRASSKTGWKADSALTIASIDASIDAMRTTITLDDDMLDDLRKGYGIPETNKLVRQALIEMRQRLATERLIALGGSDPDARAAPRRRPPRFVNPD